MDLGIHLPKFTWADGPTGIRDTLGRIAETADGIGAHRLSVMDHFFQMEIHGFNATMDMLEGYTTLGFLAARTEKVKLGLLVTGALYRYPGLLAKTVSTLDVLSGGRAYLGIGAGWYERECRGLGVQYFPIRERLQRLEETLQICRQMFSDDNGAYEGQHFQLAETLNVPQVFGRPEILIGGGGEKVLLKQVARYADACNLFSQVGTDVIQHKLNVLRGHCDTVGRDYDQIRKTLLHGGPIDPDSLLDAMAPYAAMGFHEVIVMPMSADPLAEVEALAPAVSRLREL